MIYNCRKFEKYYESKLDERLKDKIKNTHKLCDRDINKFVILPRKRILSLRIYG